MRAINGAPTAALTDLSAALDGLGEAFEERRRQLGVLRETYDRTNETLKQMVYAVLLLDERLNGPAVLDSLPLKVRDTVREFGESRRSLGRVANGLGPEVGHGEISIASVTGTPEGTGAAGSADPAAPFGGAR